MCADNHFTCVSDDMCIPDIQVCDGIPQCADQSDELPEACGEFVL